ncbi:hypothetical protein [Actinomadura geliboluensis]|uniref:hypothetical protein n=1 Tax=Actinomadura geliboluensis TaxID=882440 RepID=UPI003717C39D
MGGGADRLAFVADQDGEAVGFVHAALSLPDEDADRQVTRDPGTRRVSVNALAVPEQPAAVLACDAES